MTGGGRDRRGRSGGSGRETGGRLDGFPVTRRRAATPTTTGCTVDGCPTPAVAVGLCAEHVAVRVVWAGTVARRARRLVEVLDTDADLTDPTVRAEWVRAVQTAATDLHSTLEQRP